MPGETGLYLAPKSQIRIDDDSTTRKGKHNHKPHVLWNHCVLFSIFYLHKTNPPSSLARLSTIVSLITSRIEGIINCCAHIFYAQDE